jgi:hypothetical protein
MRQEAMPATLTGPLFPQLQRHLWYFLKYIKFPSQERCH